MADLEARKAKAVKAEEYSTAAELKAKILKLKKATEETAIVMVARTPEDSALADNTSGNAPPTSMLLPVLECFHHLLKVQTLKVNFGDSDLDDLSMLEQGLGSMTKLQELSFDFTGCADLKNISSIGQGLELLARAQASPTFTSQKLWSVKLTFFNLKLAKGSLESLMKGVAKHEQLSYLNLDFGFIKTIDVSPMQHLDGLPNLETLKLNFGDSQVVDMEALGVWLKKLKKLKKLELQLYVCLKLVNIDSLGTSLKGLKHLEDLTIDMYCCDKLESIDKFMAGVGELNSLESLTLNFDGCSKLYSIRSIKIAIIELSKTVADRSIKIDVVFACKSWSMDLNKHNQDWCLKSLTEVGDAPPNSNQPNPMLPPAVVNAIMNNFCTKCGHPGGGDNTFCGKCGAKSAQA